MRLRIALWGVVALLTLFSGATARSQTTQPTTDQRLEQLEQRLNEMDRQHRLELKARDEEIARLRDEVRTLQTPSTTTTQPAPADQIEKARQDVLKDIESREAAAPTFRTPVSFNPDIAIISDFAANVSTLNANPARNRFDVREVELDIRAAVDPRADGVLIAPIARDVEDPLFFDPANAEGGVDTAIELEEAYLYLHDFGVPNLTAKLGRFHLRFGRQNILHLHDLPTVDNNFVNQSFLGHEALSDSGLSLSYVIPPKLVADQYIEAIVEVISGEGGGDEAPVLNNDPFVDGPALNTHLLWNHDVARDWNLEIGGSWLTGKHNDDNRQNVNLFGGDVTLIHSDPTGRFNNTLLQSEFIYGDVDSSRTDTQHAFGIYVLVQQQLNRDWYAGVRADWTENAVNDNQEVWGISPYISWYWSEFLRFRLEYQHRDGDVPSEDTLYGQVTWIFGAHPPHPYWAMR
jgi:hypothetical protein